MNERMDAKSRHMTNGNTSCFKFESEKQSWPAKSIWETDSDYFHVIYCMK